MIDNFWILVTQLGSVLVYVGVTFSLYRLLAAQKDATIQAKDATIENLRIRLEKADSKDPDILVQKLNERLDASYKEIERLQKDEGNHSVKLRKLKEGNKHISKIAKVLLMRSRIRDFLLDEENENYKDFVIAICGDGAEASRSILVSGTIEELLSSRGKKVKITEEFSYTQEQRDRIIQGSISGEGQWRVYINGEVELNVLAQESLTKTHEKIRSKLAKFEDSTMM